jgi:hypothetical protein
LHINAHAAEGEIVVEVVGSEGQLLDGYQAAACQPLRQDALDHTFAWQPAAPDLNGRPVAVRLHLTNAEVFAVWWD